MGNRSIVVDVSRRLGISVGEMAIMMGYSRGYLYNVSIGHCGVTTKFRERVDRMVLEVEGDRVIEDFRRCEWIEEELIRLGYCR